MNFLILHGTGGSHESSWTPWVKAELQAAGHKVWAPDLPGADVPNIDRYADFLFASDWDFNDCVIIGHSSGSVATLGILQKLPEGTRINTAILIGAFTKRLSESPSWSMLKELFENPFDFDNLKTKSDKFIFMHSTDDPICPIDQAEYLCEQTGGEMIKFDNMSHFTVKADRKFFRLPELVEIINQKVVKP